MERNAQAQREQQQVITARFLGVFGRFHEGRPTTQRCRPDREVWGTVRFALTGENPWRDHHPDATPQRLSRMLMSLPCPELSRSAYAKMFNGQSRWPDNLADGRGTAPVLKRGSTYRLRVVDTPDLAGETDETTELYWTLLAVDPE